MKYNGIELKEFTSDRPVVFDPPRKMLVWDSTDTQTLRRVVLAYLPERNPRRVITEFGSADFCAEIPEEPKPRRATNLELAKWLAQGNGALRFCSHPFFWYPVLELKDETCNCIASEDIQIRKWDDVEWHEPTADYMDLEESDDDK